MNNQPLPQEDTIVALATGACDAGVAIVRLSGPLAIDLAQKAFRPANTTQLQPYRLHYGTFVDPHEEALDECLAVVMPGPRSFTGENIAEIHCHGGRAVVESIISTLVQLGARQAEPGEFSKRAFLNGRLDMAQAEALADLVSSKTRLAQRLALRQLRGGLSERISTIRSRLIDAAAEIEAHLDFPDEDIPALAHDRINGILATAAAEIDELLKGHERGRHVHNGIRIVLAGKPNAGKSSIFNALVGRQRAIVSPHPGTTRDTIECTADLGGLPVTYVDTAGVRISHDAVEQMGIARTNEELAMADMVLHVVDATEAQLDANLAGLGASEKNRTLVLLNKADLVSGRVADILNAGDVNQVKVSALTGMGLEDVQQHIRDEFLASDLEGEALVTRARHADCLRMALSTLQQAAQAWTTLRSGEFVMVDLKESITHLSEILGESLDEQILDRVFSTFCLGK